MIVWGVPGVSSSLAFSISSITAPAGTVLFPTQWEHPHDPASLKKHLTILGDDLKPVLKILSDNAKSLEDYMNTSYLNITCGGTVYGPVTFQSGTTFNGGALFNSTLTSTGIITANAFSGSGLGLTNVVNSAVAGTGISVSAATGAVTFTRSSDFTTVVGPNYGVRITASTADASPATLQFTNNAANAQWATIESSGLNVLTLNATTVACTTNFFADTLKIRMGALSGNASYSAIEGNKGYLLVSNTVSDDNVYLRTTNTGNVHLGGNSSSTLLVGNGVTSITGSLSATGNITSSTLIAANTFVWADSLRIRIGAWLTNPNYSTVEGNKGYAILGNTQGNESIYLRTFTATGTVRIGGNNSDTLVVGDGTTSISGSLGTSTYITCSYLAAGPTGITDGGSVSASNYFRSSGSTGWYNQTYGGGIYMDDTVRLKVFGGKSFWGNLGFESQVSYGSYGSMSLYSTNGGWGGITFPDQKVTWMQGFGQAIFGVYRDNTTWNFYYNYATFVASDARYKREIKPLTFGLNLINALEPVEFKRLTERNDDDPEAVEEEIFYGFTAQQVKEALDLVGETRDTNLWDLGGPETIETPSDRQYISEGTLIAPIVKALQELDTRLKTLEGV